MRRIGTTFLGVFALLLSGCGVGELPGYYFKIKAVGLDDTCTGAPANWKEDIEYRVVIEGEDLEIAVGPDVFATGSAQGCTLNYRSVIWGDDVDGFDIRWQIAGNATFNPGGKTCTTGNGTDWDGQEYFEVVNSEDPSISPGCSYDLALSGKFVKQVK